VQFDAKVVIIKLDRETSFSNKFSDFVMEKGYKVERSAPDTQEQNGGAERQGGIYAIKGRAMRIEANLPHDIWPKVLKTSGYITNQTPIKALNWKTPYEAVTGQKPMLVHLHPLGCKAYALDKTIPKRHRLIKLDPRAHISYLVNYDSTNIFRI